MNEYKNFFLKYKIKIENFFSVFSHSEVPVSFLAISAIYVFCLHKHFTVPAKMSYQKIYVPSKWLLNFDKYGYEGHVDIK